MTRRRTGAGSPPGGAAPPQAALQTEVLEDLRGARHYRRWLVRLADPYLGDAPVEIGSGIGDYAAELAVGRSSFTATEPDPQRCAALAARFADDPVVTVRQLGLPVTESGAHTGLVMFNVLEHIADDVAALRSAAGLVRPGGAVVVYVPAFPFAMSRFDRLIGHHRRYTRRTLRETVTAAGLDIARLHYVNSVGLLSWFLLMRCARRIPRDGPALRWYDATVIRAVAAVESGLRPPFGQSLVAVAHRRT